MQAAVVVVFAIEMTEGDGLSQDYALQRIEKRGRHTLRQSSAHISMFCALYLEPLPLFGSIAVSRGTELRHFSLVGFRPSARRRI